MTIDADDAKRALADIQSATEKSSTLRGYAAGGSYLIVWGLVWIVGGSAGLISPMFARWGWIVAIVAGAAASISLGLRTQSGPQTGMMLGKLVAMMLVMAAVSTAISVVLDVASVRAAFALQALIVAGLYMGYGVWRGARIFAVGLALGVAVLSGWFYLRDQFELFVGIVGGLVLIISGVWLRRA